MQQGLAYAFSDIGKQCRWIEKHVPAVPPEVTAQVYGEAREKGNNYHKQPAPKEPKPSAGYLTYGLERAKAEHSPGDREGTDQEEVEPPWNTDGRPGVEMDKIGDDVRGVWKKDQPEKTEKPEPHAAAVLLKEMDGIRKKER